MDPITGDKPTIGRLLKPLEKGQGVSNKVDNYVKFFDPTKKDEDLQNERKVNRVEVVNQYYDIATDFFEYGWGESFHFAPMYRGESREHCFAKHEYKLALKLGLQPGDRVLDMGCGVGGPGRHIAMFSDTNIVGLNLNDYQITRAKELTRKAGMEHLCSYVQGDFCKIPFKSETFDKVYAIEATCHAGLDLVQPYKEAYRLLKPGGLFASYEFIMTNKYDPTNSYHKKVKAELLEGNGLPELGNTDTAIEAMKNAGFELMEAQDYALKSPLPWYVVLTPQWTVSDIKITPIGRYMTHVMLMGMEATGLCPKGTVKVHKTLCKGADALVKAGKEGIFTPLFLVVGRKPLKK